MSDLICPECKNLIPIGAQSCPSCGLPIDNNYCEECGHLLNIYDTICPNCGCPVSSSNISHASNQMLMVDVRETKPLASKKSFLWIALGSGLGVLLLLIISVLIVFHPFSKIDWSMRKKETNETADITALRKKAIKGDAESQYQLSQDYLNGLGVLKNYEKSFKWCRVAAINGFAPAECLLANHYADGIGTEVDTITAFEWLLKSANHDYVEAQYQVAVDYQTGRYTCPSQTSAVEWMKKAAQQGHAEAQYQLGLFYVSGYGVERDIDQAMNWMKKAAEQGNENAAVALVELQLNDLYYDIDYFIVELNTRVESYGLFGGVDDTRYSCGNTYQVFPIGRLIDIKILSYSAPVASYSNLRNILAVHYANDYRVNKVYICEGGTVVVDCRY